MINLKIKLSEITDSPGGRYKEDGPYSAQWFYEDVIKGVFLEIKSLESCKDVKFVIDLDGVYGVCDSFIDQLIYYLNSMVKFMFGENSGVKQHFDFISEEEKELYKSIDNSIIDYGVLFKSDPNQSGFPCDDVIDYINQKRK